VIAHLLSEHRFLTTDQIAAVVFTSPRTCRNRLDVLRQLDFIDWFMPVHPQRGRLPVHWVPGRLSTRYVALYHGEPAPSPRKVRDQRDANSCAATRIGHLNHTDGTNQFFVDLLAHTRIHPEARLARWWSAARTFATVNHNTRPDAHGVWREGDQEVAFFLEYDTGTEFSGGRCPCRSPDLRVSAAQRLMGRRYRPRQVWCKHVCGVSPVRAVVAGRPSVHVGQRGGVAWVGHGSSVPAAASWLCGGGVLSRVLGGRVLESAAFRAWCPCGGSVRGRCARRCRDRHPDRPRRQVWAAAQGWFVGGAVLLRKTFRGLSCGGGTYA
jgi:hypothetical protein